jgi:hypothetical protein
MTRGDRLFFDQALRDVNIAFKETPWDVARTYGALLAHVWIEKHDPQTCIICARAEVYVTVLSGALQLPPQDEG